MREEVLAVAKELLARGLVSGTSGNVSARMGDGSVCITPSSVPYETMTLEDLVIVDLDANVLQGTRYPSSEKDLHLTAYKAYPEVGGVIHSHPIYATMFACARQPIPAMIDEFAIYVGGDVPVAEYGMSGTHDLADNATSKLKDVGAVLLANHGMCAVGNSARKALQVTALVERSAQILFGARLLGEVAPLPDEVNTNFGGLYRYLRSNPQPSAGD